MPKVITLDTQKELVKYYLSRPMQLAECAQKFGMIPHTVVKILKRFHVEQWSKMHENNPELDEAYFESVNSPQKAYWIGLLMYHGYIFTKKNGDMILRFTMPTKDRYLIQNFLNDIRCNKKIIKMNGTKDSSVQVHSTKMCEDLSKWGIAPDEEVHRSITFPPFPEAYMHGLVDGGASIGFYARDKRNCHAKTIIFGCVNKEFIDSLYSYFGFGRVYYSSNTWYICWQTVDYLTSVVDTINKYSTHELTRKRELIDKIHEELRKYRDKQNSLPS